MPDRTLCVSVQCPLRENCDRHESARPERGWTGWQAYMDFYHEGDECLYYEAITKEKGNEFPRNPTAQGRLF
jgi:hypothetical protein